jgi:tRNA 2-thiouridine synthesizing protein A
MATVVDARGLSCPQPVILVRKAMEAGEYPIEVLVDGGAARENVTRMAERAGCQVQCEVTGDECKLVISTAG